MRKFCGFKKVPDASKITRFKQDFLDDLQAVLDNLVDFTEPICQAIDSTKGGRMVYIYPEKNLRAYPGTIRGTQEWDDNYKTRTIVERDINHIKENICLASRRNQDEKT